MYLPHIMVENEMAMTLRSKTMLATPHVFRGTLIINVAPVKVKNGLKFLKMGS
jgi:hypothetical protein